MLQSVVTRFRQLYDTPQQDQPRASKKRKLDQLEAESAEAAHTTESKKPQVESSSFLQKFFGGSSPQDLQTIESLRSQLTIQEKLVNQLQQDLKSKDQIIKDLELKLSVLQSTPPLSDKNMTVEDIKTKQDNKLVEPQIDFVEHLQSPLTSEPSEPNSPAQLELADENSKDQASVSSD